jgi:hypothetical protein
MMKVSTVCLGFIAACGLVTSMQSRADTTDQYTTGYYTGNKLMDICEDENVTIIAIANAFACEE